MMRFGHTYKGVMKKRWFEFADIAQIAGTPLEQRPDQRGICRFYLGA